MAEPETLFFEGPDAFEVWLEGHGEASTGVWIRMAKKGTGIASLDWTRARRIAKYVGMLAAGELPHP